MAISNRRLAGVWGEPSSNWATVLSARSRRKGRIAARRHSALACRLCFQQTHLKRELRQACNLTQLHFASILSLPHAIVKIRRNLWPEPWKGRLITDNRLKAGNPGSPAGDSKKVE